MVSRRQFMQRMLGLSAAAMLPPAMASRSGDSCGAVVSRDRGGVVTSDSRGVRPDVW